MCPKSGVKTLRKFGVPEGNIAEWQANKKGAEQLGTQVSQGLQSFYEARKDGQRAVSKFFVTDLSSVSTADVSGALDDLSSKCERWTLKAGGAIRVVVEDILKKDKKAAAIVGTKYKTGRAYYELTKPETVQARKRMVIVDHKTGAIYGGGQARRLLGFPDGESCKVKPGNHGDFAVFVESTSVNRVLVAKTTLLYSHNG